jgi:hypothetical protein
MPRRPSPGAHARAVSWPVGINVFGHDSTLSTINPGHAIGWHVLLVKPVTQIEQTRNQHQRRHEK